jgi:hypothetical protein
MSKDSGFNLKEYIRQMSSARDWNIRSHMVGVEKW